MSFILDALRKSETERQKTQPLGIGDAPMIVHQKHMPRWAVGLIACLSAGLVTLGWFWLRDDGTGANRGATASSTRPTAGVAVPSARALPDTTTSSTHPASPMPSVSFPLGEARDWSGETRRGKTAPTADSTGNAPASQATPTATATATEILAAPMPTLAQYRASGGTLPALNLELHVYSPIATERFVFINSSKYVEGQTLAEGPRLGTITQDGAVLIHQGRSLLLPRE